MRFQARVAWTFLDALTPDLRAALLVSLRQAELDDTTFYTFWRDNPFLAPFNRLFGEQVGLHLPTLRDVEGASEMDAVKGAVVGAVQASVLALVGTLNPPPVPGAPPYTPLRVKALAEDFRNSTPASGVCPSPARTIYGASSCAESPPPSHPVTPFPTSPEGVVGGGSRSVDVIEGSRETHRPVNRRLWEDLDAVDRAAWPPARDGGPPAPPAGL